MSVIGLILIAIGFLKILFAVNLNDFKYCPNACAYRLQIKQIFNHIVTKLYNPLDHIKNYECDKDGLVPKFNNKGGKNGQRKKIKSWKNY